MCKCDKSVRRDKKRSYKIILKTNNNIYFIEISHMNSIPITINWSIPSFTPDPKSTSPNMAHTQTRPN